MKGRLIFYFAPLLPDLSLLVPFFASFYSIQSCMSRHSKQRISLPHDHDTATKQCL